MNLAQMCKECKCIEQPFSFHIKALRNHSRFICRGVVVQNVEGSSLGATHFFLNAGNHRVIYKWTFGMKA